MTKTFLITGVSSGFGRAFAEAALQDGHTVVGTVRRPEDAEKYRALTRDRRAIPILLDITDDDAVSAAIEEIEDGVGPIDVLIANAGYGHEGVLEESPMAELRRQFDVNVFGAVAVIKAVLPGMRERRSGHILGVTSMGGLMTVPGLAYYCGSKFALEAILETLGKEVAAFGVHVMAIAPGSFRTDWAGRSMVRTARYVPDYDELMDPIRAARESASGNQLGDPAKAARAVLDVIDSDSPPIHLLLGSDALRLVTDSRASFAAEIERWSDVSRSTDIVGGAQLAG
jgi:NAD(P)-dependent dehydrogenase (short-subunit alcohol dehydrogenase family)